MVVVWEAQGTLERAQESWVVAEEKQRSSALPLPATVGQDCAVTPFKEAGVWRKRAVLVPCSILCDCFADGL